jgi:hypothetical protein
VEQEIFLVRCRRKSSANWASPSDTGEELMRLGVDFTAETATIGCRPANKAAMHRGHSRPRLALNAACTSSRSGASLRPGTNRRGRPLPSRENLQRARHRPAAFAPGRSSRGLAFGQRPAPFRLAGFSAQDIAGDSTAFACFFDDFRQSFTYWNCSRIAMISIFQQSFLDEFKIRFRLGYTSACRSASVPSHGGFNQSRTDLAGPSHATSSGSASTK